MLSNLCRVFCKSILQSVCLDRWITFCKLSPIRHATSCAFIPTYTARVCKRMPTQIQVTSLLILNTLEFFSATLGPKPVKEI
jgi:hypothetical protein